MLIYCVKLDHVLYSINCGLQNLHFFYLCCRLRGIFWWERSLRRWIETTASSHSGTHSTSLNKVHTYYTLALLYFICTKNYVNLLSQYFFIVLGWKYSSGFISAEMISEHLPPPGASTQILMCGPPPMIKFACLPNLEKLHYTEDMYVPFWRK